MKLVSLSIFWKKCRQNSGKERASQPTRIDFVSSKVEIECSFNNTLSSTLIVHQYQVNLFD